jgi:large subunit ribosomal protein L23
VSNTPAIRTKGPKLEAHQIVLRPIITEKSGHQHSHRGAIAFEVNPWSTKDEIKAAVEEMFGVRVTKVRTANRQGKQKRFKFKLGRLPHWKKAMVTLHPESPGIDLI